VDPVAVTAAHARIAQIMSLAATAGAPAPSSAATAAAPAPPAPAAAAGTPAGTFGAHLARASAPAAASPAPAGGSDQDLARRIDAWIAARTPSSPLAGLGHEFVAAGRANGIDPRLLVAIAAQESALGTAGSGRAINNAFGWGPAIPFASWTEGIHRIAAGLRRGYVDEGRDTIAEIQGKWAPVGASNDPGGLNGGWTAGVSRLYAELGGDPAASVRRP